MPRLLSYAAPQARESASRSILISPWLLLVALLNLLLGLGCWVVAGDEWGFILIYGPAIILLLLQTFFFTIPVSLRIVRHSNLSWWSGIVAIIVLSSGTLLTLATCIFRLGFL